MNVYRPVDAQSSGFANVEQQARALYEAGGNQVKPTWDQIGDVTRSVWRERAEALAYGDLA